MTEHTPEQAATLQRLKVGVAISDIHQARIEQVTHFGHTDETDANEPIFYHATAAVNRMNDAIDVLRAADPTNPKALDRLQTARRKLVKALALGLTAIDRIDPLINQLSHQAEPTTERTAA